MITIFAEGYPKGTSNALNLSISRRKMRVVSSRINKRCFKNSSSFM
jgi:hypothetical protein